MDQEGALFPGLMKAMAKSYGKSQGGNMAALVDGAIGLLDWLQSSFPAASSTPGTFDMITCGPASGAAVRRAAGVPAWRYRWFGEWPNLEIYPGIGAYHSMDCPIVFGATERASSIPDTPEEAKFVKNI